jgi:hypothetical protein
VWTPHTFTGRLFHAFLVFMAQFLLALGLISTAAFAQSSCPVPPKKTFNDALSDTRKLRRISLVLRGTTPEESELTAMLAASTPEARAALLDNAISAGLSNPKFYQQMFYFGQEWISVGAYTQGAYGDAYQGDMAGHVFVCPKDTAHAGKYYLNNDPDNPSVPGESTPRLCRNLNKDNVSFTPPTASREPWWAPGTTVGVVGTAATNVATVPGPNGTTRDCGVAEGGYYDAALAPGCGCGPNMVWCIPLRGLQAGSVYDLNTAQRRHPFEEPARLLAHIAWHDRDLSDLVLGNYSVGTNLLQHLYTRWGRQQGPKATDTDTSWWNAAADGAPRDPLHPNAGDAQAWREFVVEKRNPYLLALNPTASGGLLRTYSFDPRSVTAEPLGVPAAGVLTMLGPNSTWPRERVRAARFTEIFACQSFSPPAPNSTFPPYTNDPATGGTCKHCHATMDPAAIYFKRWDFSPRDSYYVPWPFLAGIGNFRVTKEWLSGSYPHSPADNSPGFRWKSAFVPNTVMTPVTPAQLESNPESLLLDTMPASSTLFGQPGDGVMGPLGFGRLLVKSGEFDRCAVRRLYTRVVGRDLKADEADYLNALVETFVKNGRKVKPFVKHLMQQPEFGRGL